MTTASDLLPKPSLVIFDLDFTLWDCGGLWIDCTSYPFFRKEGEGRICDSAGRTLRYYEDVPSILDSLDSWGVPMALASRTHQPEWAQELLALMRVRDRFEYAEIYPGSKLTHFEALQQESGIAYEEMLFFDDESRNIEEVGTLGVCAVEVRAGMSFEVFEKALHRFANQ